MSPTDALRYRSEPDGEPWPSEIGEGPLPGLQATGTSALYLDIDGTILDLAPRPEAVHVPAWMVPLLQRLAHRLGGALAFVSGRPIAAIDTLFQPMRLAAIGVHGGQIRASAGGEVFTDERGAKQLQTALPRLQEAAAGIRGVQLENKHSVIALHYRSVPERGREVQRIAELFADSLEGPFGVLVGKCVVEIRPSHLGKGAALRLLMEHTPFRGRRPIFAGDDGSDEEAFRFVNGLGGLSVRVGDDAPTAARYRLASPEQLRAWLLEVADD